MVHTGIDHVDDRRSAIQRHGDRLRGFVLGKVLDNDLDRLLAIELDVRRIPENADLRRGTGVVRKVGVIDGNAPRVDVWLVN